MKKALLLTALVLWAIPGVACFGGMIYPLANGTFDTGWTVELMGQFDGEISLFYFTAPEITGANGSIQLQQATRLVVELDKTFRSRVFDDSGIGQVAAVKFTLVNPDAPNFTPVFTIHDEKINNSTGLPWTDFHMQIGWDLNAETPGAWFNPDHIFSAPGTAANPFKSVEFGTKIVNGQTYNDQVNFFNGVMAPSDQYYTFGGDGSYVQIDTLMAKGQYFILKEYPTIPEPATISILLLGGMFMTNRFRRIAR
jgi:hypothetical protein